MRRALAAMWLVLARSVRVSPWQTAVCCLELVGAAGQVVQPLLLALFVDGATRHDARQMALAAGAFSGVVTLVVALQLAGNTARIGQRERVGFSFDADIATLTADIPTLDHLESPEYLDELQALHDQQGALGNALNAVLNTLRNLTWAGGTVLLAAAADPRLLLLAVAGLPTLLTTTWSIRWQRAAEKASAEPGRRVAHLLGLSTTPAGAAELRVFGLAGVLRERLGESVAAWRAPFVRLGGRSGLVTAANGVLFYGTAVAVLGWLLHDMIAGRLSVGALVLAVLLAGRLQSIGQTVEWSMRFLADTVRTTNRFIWLRDYAARIGAEHPGCQPPPDRLATGLRCEGLTYGYPGAAEPALADVTLDLPAGAVVALVGENGAGKSTLVKLLTGMYRPTAGRVLVDGVDLSRLDVAGWRDRCSGAFQDYARLELTARHAVGVGAVGHADDDGRVHTALAAGAATGVLTALPAGLDTQLGSGWPAGVDLSGGQWQRLAIARGMMREQPLLLVLDEPTAALDAATEHALFERYADAARQAGRHGGVTLLVTHRFSTVAAADLVVVLDHGRVVEVGPHGQLIAAGGRYAQLYELQARGYR